jgi:tRNA-dihydrouridine synthase B
MKDIIKYIVDSKAVLSPLAGISDLAYRLMCRKFGCRFAFTEMVDANAVLYAKPERFRLLDTTPKDSPLGVQLNEYDEEKLLEAALICEEKGVFSVLNLNFACPMRKQIKRKKGIYLMKEPKQVAKIISVLVKNIKMPITIKIRSGYDNDNRNCAEIAKIAQEEGAKAVFLHPRSGVQKYKGNICKQDIFNVKKNINVPLIVSGNLFTANDAVSMLEETKCSAVAIARGSFGKPWIFEDINRILNGEIDSDKDRSLEFKIQIIKEHFSLMSSFIPVNIAISRMYKNILWYLSGYKLLHELMKQYKEQVNLKEDFELFVDKNIYLSLKEFEDGMV